MMDLVVTLALVVLGAVFIVSAVVLLIMCRRRRMQISYIKPTMRFKKLNNENYDILQLNPLITNVLDNNSWVYDVTGLLQHCVAVLRLCHQLSEKLAAIPLHQASPQLSHLLCEATQRVMPRFDDLLSAINTRDVDVRVLEARATALATVCWALLLPFSVLNPKYNEIVGDPLREMDTHLEVLRQAADLAERIDIGKVNIDWARMGEQDTGEPMTVQTEVLPLIDHSKLPPQTSVVTTHDTHSYDESNLANGNGHPIDPAA